MSSQVPRILLVEDEMWLSALYSDSLKAAQFAVLTAVDPDKALTVLDTEPIDLIILDMFLPGHNGIELLHELASYHDLNSIPIIILSAVHQRDFILDAERWRHYGVVNYLYKPHTKPDQLVAAVEKQFILQTATS